MCRPTVVPVGTRFGSSGCHVWQCGYPDRQFEGVRVSLLMDMSGCWTDRGVELAQAPSSDAKFRRIFDQHFVEVQRYCVRRLSPADANDATSEVFLVAWRRIDSVPGGGEALPWLIGVARNVVRNAARSNTRSLRLASKVSQQRTEYSPSPETQVVMGSQFAEVEAALELLSDDDREVIRLRTWEELTAPEIATVFGCSTSAAEKRVTRAWQRLSKAVERNRTIRPRELEKGGDDRGT